MDSLIWFPCVAFLLNNHFKGNQRTVVFSIPSFKLRVLIVAETAKKGLRNLQWIVWSSKQHTSLTCKCYWQRKADWFSIHEYFFPWIWLDFSSKEPALGQTKYPESSTSGRGTRSSYLTMCPEISARWSLLWAKFQIPVARQAGREGEKCRPLEHMWRIPLIHSPRFIIDGNFFIYYMAGSASGQYAANSVFWLATRAGKMERYRPPGTARFVPANKISPKFKRVHESLLSPKLFSAKVKRCFVFSLSLWNQKKRQREWKQRKKNVDEF